MWRLTVLPRHLQKNSTQLRCVRETLRGSLLLVPASLAARQPRGSQLQQPPCGPPALTSPAGRDVTSLCSVLVEGPTAGLSRSRSIPELVKVFFIIRTFYLEKF